MNNQIPYYIPNSPMNNPQHDIQLELERITNKINRLEKNIRILENRLRQLENKNNNYPPISDDPTDMYMI